MSLEIESYFPVPQHLAFERYTEWARRAERRGDVQRAQNHRDNRWHRCPHGP